MSVPDDIAVSEFKLLYDLTTTAKDEIVRLCLQSGYDAFEKYTDCLIDETLVTSAFEGDGRTLYVPSKNPIISIQSLKINDETVAESTTYTQSGYYIDGRLVKLRGYSFSGWIEISYKAGKILENNFSLKQSIYEYSYLIYQNNKRAGIKSQTIGEKTISYADDVMTVNIKRLWDMEKNKIC